jgi:hypothetical protein
MDPFTLANKIASLEVDATATDVWLNVSTCAVVVGVVFELLVLVTEYRRELKDFKRGVIHSPEKPTLRRYFVEGFGAALVALGVAGELFFHLKAGRIETRLRNTNHQLVATIQGEASNAAERAAANEIKAAQLRKQAEDERMARVQIEEALQPRRLNRKEQSALNAGVSGFAGETVSLWFPMVDTEAQLFASELALALHKAGWRVFAPAGVITTPQSGRPFKGPEEIKTGISIASTEDSRGLLAAKALVDSLNSLGFTAEQSPHTESFSKRGTSLVIVNVGARPLGPQGKARLMSSKRGERPR